MPIIKSAIKKLRQDRKKEKHNQLFEDLMKDAVKKAVSSKKEADIKSAISLVGKAAKKNIIHRNKASRLTSRLSKLTRSKKGATTKPTTVKKKVGKKTSKKKS